MSRTPFAPFQSALRGLCIAALAIPALAHSAPAAPAHPPAKTVLAKQAALAPVTDAQAAALAQRVKDETGLRTIFHHHIGTWVETPAETARLLDMTDPKLLGLCFDTGHWKFGGGDPVEGLKKHADRIWHVHFKDHEPNVARMSRDP